MLRQFGFLPCQLHVAWMLAHENYEPEKLELLFGKSREFLPARSRAQGQTPLVNNIVSAAAFTDQYGRVYAFADPSDFEYDPEDSSIPHVPVTNRLFVAVTNAGRRDFNNSGELPAEYGSLPTPDEELKLRRTDGTQITVTVSSILEPSTYEPRASSGLIELNDLLSVTGRGQVYPQARFETALARIA